MDRRRDGTFVASLGTLGKGKKARHERNWSWGESRPGGGVSARSFLARALRPGHTEAARRRRRWRSPSSLPPLRSRARRLSCKVPGRLVRGPGPFPATTVLMRP